MSLKLLGQVPFAILYTRAALIKGVAKLLRLEKRALLTDSVYCGKAMADSMPMINTTTSNSMSVNALFIYSPMSFLQPCSLRARGVKMCFLQPTTTDSLPKKKNESRGIFTFSKIYA